MAKRKAKKKLKPVKMPKPEVIEAGKKSTALVRQTREPQKIMKLAVIKDDKQYSSVASVVKWTKDTITDAEKERKAIIAGAQQTVRLVNAKYKPAREAIEEIQKHGVSLLRSYDEKLRAEERKKTEKEAAKARKAGNEQYADDLEDMAMIARPRTRTNGDLGQRDYWHAEVTDLGQLLLAFIEGKNPILKPLRKDLETWLATRLSATARNAKNEDIGVAGAKGVREIGYSNKPGS